MTFEIDEKVRILAEDGAFEGIVVEVYSNEKSALVKYEDDRDAVRTRVFTFEELEYAHDCWLEALNWE